MRGAGRNGKMDRIHHGVCQAASPFSGVFWVPEGESPTGDGHLTPETTGVVPFCLLVFLLLLLEAAAAAVVSAGCRIDVQGMGVVAGGRGGI